MANFSRRDLIKHSSLSAAAAGALFMAPKFASANSGTVLTTAGQSSPLFREPLAAYIHDASTGELSLLIGSRQVIVRDPDLVRRLVQAAQ
jgi:hypothetical protein